MCCGRVWSTSVPTTFADLHRRASDWFHGAGEPEAAVRHCADRGRRDAGRPTGSSWPSPRCSDSAVRRWCAGGWSSCRRTSPTNRPVLAVGFIGALMSSNEFDGVDGRLRTVERLLADPPADLVVVDQAEFARLPAAVETYRAALALVDGDLAGAGRSTPSPPSSVPVPRTTSPSRQRLPLVGTGVLDARRPGGCAPRLPGRLRPSGRGGTRRRRGRLRHHARRHRDDPRQARRRRADVRGRPRAGRSGVAPSRGESPTCTSG